MPLWTCDVEACDKPAVRALGECILCDRHLCAKHLQPPIHGCPKWEDADNYDPAMLAAQKAEIDQLLAAVDRRALETLASSLRNGVNCHIPDLQYDRATRSTVMGGMNYHVEIKFDDGVAWMARIRRSNATSPPSALRDYIITSEIATLKFLETTSVPAPRVRGFALEGEPDNNVGVGFILMEKLPGRSFDRSKITDAQMASLTEQLVDISMELYSHAFQSMGSLDRPGTHHIGPLAREFLTDFSGSDMSTVGPCSSLQEYYRSTVQMNLNLIVNQEMYTTRSVDAYLIHLFFRDLVSKVFSDTMASTHFYLKHADDKGDHILVDEQNNITGIIDWEWAHTAPIEMAFNSSLMLFDVNNFYNGKQELSKDEEMFAQCLEKRGGQELANAVRSGRVRHFFSFCCGCDLEDWDGLVGLFRGLRDGVGVDAGLGWSEWRAVALERYGGNAELKKLLERGERST